MTEEEITEIVARVVAELQNPVVTPQASQQTRFQVLTGEVIKADHINSLADQAVPKYDTSALLKTAWPQAPVGSLAYVKDVNALFVWDAPITTSVAAWHVLGGLRMGYATMGLGQDILNNTFTLIKRGTTAGAAGKVGRGTWNVDGSVTVPVAGTYLVTGSISWPSNSTGQRRLYIRRFTTAWTPTGTAGGATEENTAGASQLNQSVSAMVACNAGDKIGMHCSQTSGVTLKLPAAGSGYETRLAVHLLGAE